MKIVACIKVVPEEQDIVIEADHTLSFAKAELKVGQYDLNAVEAGVQLEEANGNCETIILSMGSGNLKNSKLQKAILSRGGSQMFGVTVDHPESVDSYATAKNLAAAIRKIGNVDLVLCGEGSGDIYSQQVGPVLGQLLGYANLNAVSKITAKAGELLVERTLEKEIEVLEVPLPAVLSVSSDINKPRIPGLKDVLAAGKKPVTFWGAADLEITDTGSIEVVSTLAPQQADRKKIILDDDSEESIKTLANHLRKAI